MATAGVLIVPLKYLCKHQYLGLLKANLHLICGFCFEKRHSIVPVACIESLLATIE